MGELFQDSGCSGCHLVRGEGGVRGPDLSVIGSQRSVGHLRESIIDPGAEVVPEYWVAKIVTRDGSNRTGFILNQDSYAVQLLDFSGGLQRIERTSSRISALPQFDHAVLQRETERRGTERPGRFSGVAETSTGEQAMKLGIGLMAIGTLYGQLTYERLLQAVGAEQLADLLRRLQGMALQ